MRRFAWFGPRHAVSTADRLPVRKVWPQGYCAVVALISDTSRGDWLRRRAGEWATAGGVAGTGFEAYARILHPLPARWEDLDTPDGWAGHPVVEVRAWTWAELAIRNGRHVHPLVQWVNLSGQEPPQGVELDDGRTVGPPEEGQLDGSVLAALTEHLRPATTTPDDLIAAVWNGWGELNGGSGSATFFVGEPSEEQVRQLQEQAQRRRLLESSIANALSGPTFEWPGREFHLLSASLSLFAKSDWLDTASVDAWPAAGHSPQDAVADGPQLGAGDGDRLGLHHRRRPPRPHRRGARRQPVRSVRHRRKR